MHGKPEIHKNRHKGWVWRKHIPISLRVCLRMGYTGILPKWLYKIWEHDYEILWKCMNNQSCWGTIFSDKLPDFIGKKTGSFLQNFPNKNNQFIDHPSLIQSRDPQEWNPPGGGAAVAEQAMEVASLLPTETVDMSLSTGHILPNGNVNRYM